MGLRWNRSIRWDGYTHKVIKFIVITIVTVGGRNGGCLCLCCPSYTTTSLCRHPLLLLLLLLSGLEVVLDEWGERRVVDEWHDWIPDATQHLWATDGLP